MEILNKLKMSFRAWFSISHNEIKLHTWLEPMFRKFWAVFVYVWFKDFLKIEIEVPHLEQTEQSAEKLNQALVKSFAEMGIDDLADPDKLVVDIEKPKELAVIETAVVLGLIGIAKSLVELYKYLKEKELEEQKLDLEKAKLEIQKLSEDERTRLRDAFVQENLPQILVQANITNVANIATAVVRG